MAKILESRSTRREAKRRGDSAEEETSRGERRGTSRYIVGELKTEDGTTGHIFVASASAALTRRLLLIGPEDISHKRNVLVTINDTRRGRQRIRGHTDASRHGLRKGDRQSVGDWFFTPLVVDSSEVCSD